MRLIRGRRGDVVRLLQREADEVGGPVTTNRVTNLLRKRGSPQRPTFLELFFDLVYVFALTRIVNELVLDYTTGRVAETLTTTLSENGETLLLFLAIWWIWTQTAWMTSRFDPVAAGDPVRCPRDDAREPVPGGRDIRGSRGDRSALREHIRGDPGGPHPLLRTHLAGP
ncbi:low temperature requirement protein A [Micromonospora sp. NPDC007230]|uniref:low temperature requirement protein A n=1 Tax=Micromonospora sp. NPDC007230 TaxID=3364237 RepID=UPI00367EF9E6